MSAPAGPAVTLLIPVTGAEAHLLGGTLDSLLAQSARPGEVILLSLEPGAGLWDQLLLLQRHELNIVLVQQKAGGLAGALSAGLALASGDLLSWLIPGSHLRPNALEVLAGALSRRPDRDVAFAWCPRRERDPRVSTGMGEIGLTELLDHNPIGCAFLARRSALQAVGSGSAEFPGAEMWEYWIRLAERSPLLSVPEVLCACREEPPRGEVAFPDPMVVRALVAHHRRRHRVRDAEAAPEGQPAEIHTAARAPAKGTARPRVLLIAREVVPGGGYGIGRQTRGLARALAAQGCSVHVLVGRASGGRAALREGFRMHAPAHRPPFSAPTSVADLLQDQSLMLAEALDVHQRFGPFDIVHAHGWDCASLAYAIRQVHRTPLVVTMHRIEAMEIAGSDSAEDLYVKEIESWIGGEADLIICHSQFAAAQTRLLCGLTAERVQEAPLCVTEEDWRTDADGQAFRELFGPPGCKLVSFAGRLQSSKGPQVLVECLPHILAVAPNVRVVIAGEGPLEGALHQRVAELGLDSVVTLPGYLSGKVLATLLHASSVHVVPSLVEASGGAALEALACGVPVVAAASGGLPEVVAHESRGLLVPAGDPRSLAEAVVRLLYDGQLAANAAEAGRQHVARECTAAAAAARVLHLYSRARQ